MMSDDGSQQSMQAISRGLRAYFAPVHREDGAATIFDPSKHSQFDLEHPPTPWLDAGWIAGLKRISETKKGILRSGKRGSVATQYRLQLGAHLEVEFRQWGKLQIALSAGSEHLNVLESTPESAEAPVGSGSVAAEIVQPNSNSSEIFLLPGALGRFNPGDIVAIDVDYQQETGFLGTGIAAGFIGASDVVPGDPNYTRRITFNVARIAAKTGNSIQLATPLVGGDPRPGAGIQKVVAFTDREGGSYFQEWSALFVLPEVSGGRIYFYYPRLQSSGAPDEAQADLGGGLVLNSLRARFTAMPISDSCDGESAVCYRTYVPAANAAVLI
jgi:hypothetical protein